MDFLDLLTDPAYRHVLFNHVPVVGLAVALLVLACGLVIRERATTLLGLALVALTAGASIPVVNFGDAAYPEIYDTLDGYGRAWLDHHAEVADAWAPLLYATAGLALAGFAAGVLRRALLAPAAALVLVIALGALGAAALIASSGGKVKHPEFRIETLPPGQ